jgi:ATP-dependent helicase/nuclease subunit B
LLELPKLLLEELEAGGTLVTPSRQRAAAARLALAAAKLRRKEKLWRTPDVVAFGPWLEREALRRADVSETRVLRNSSEWLLWRQAVAHVMRDAEVPPNDSLVESLRHSARVLFDWHIPIETVDRIGDAESLLLVRTILWVEEQCAHQRVIPSHRLIERLQATAARAPITFAGFSERSAARAALMDRWAARAPRMREHRNEGKPGTARIISAHDPADEVAAAAAWCRELLEQDPARRLLIIIPDLTQRHYAISQVFEQALAPQSVLGQAQADQRARFAIEGGQPLSLFPLVRQALSSLQFLCGKLDFARWSAWLRSAFWGSPAPAARARLEAYLRRGLDIELGVTEMLAALQSAPSELDFIVDSLRATVTSAVQVIEANAEATSALVWSRRFGAALRALGWPGARPLSSAEQQTLIRFHELLAEFAAVAPNAGTLRAIDAVKLLEELAARSAFEPATGDPAVTLTAALTDPVVRYDGLWVAGLHADVWPRPVSIDPFIPLAAQKQAGIPAVSPTRLLEQARGMLQFWQRSTDQFVVSWPRQDGEREYLPSPLLDELQRRAPRRVEQFELAFGDQNTSDTGKPPARSRKKAANRLAEDVPVIVRTTDPDASRTSTLAHVVRASRRVEYFEDAQGDPWPKNRPVPAGTRTIEYQNRCPVRAYAELRLASVPLETPRPGVDFRERGTLLHRALELLWSRLGGSQELREWHGPRLNALIDESVTQAMADAFGDGGIFQQQRAMVREHRRTARLIRDLCDLELQRPPFRIRALEARRTWASQSGCSLDLRIDRIDQFEDGTHAIFDYKSGAPQIQDWLGERITHPQLLVYLLAAQAEVSALATVQLSPARVGFKGIADRKGRLPRVAGLEGQARWSEQTERWRQTIEQLAADFLAGSAVLDPMPNACRTCHLHAFCRIANVSGDDDGAEE